MDFPFRDRWVTPHDKDPFVVPMAEKLELLRRVSEEARKGAKVFSASATLSIRGEDMAPTRHPKIGVWKSSIAGSDFVKRMLDELEAIMIGADIGVTTTEVL
jgi:hypothetical protein